VGGWTPGVVCLIRVSYRIGGVFVKTLGDSLLFVLVNRSDERGNDECGQGHECHGHARKECDDERGYDYQNDEVCEYCDDTTTSSWVGALS
jgi:hypothetical protein